MQFLDRTTYSIISLGCSKNLVDSEFMNGSLTQAGFCRADDTREAHILIINTCAFITPAIEESLEEIFDALEENPDRKVVVVGCLGSRYGREIEEQIPEITHVSGIPGPAFGRELARSLGLEPVQGGHDVSRIPLVEGLPYAYLKISEGCSNNCSYCTIPLIRGPLVNRSLDDLVAEAESLVKRGALELNLIAQDTSLYRDGDRDLYDLLNALSELEGLQWIRILYCHPDHLNERIIQGLKLRKVVPYLDLPFQHVNRDILRAMNRRGSGEVYRNLVHRLRREIPGITLRSTFMTGFPGEGEDEYQELLEFIEEIRLDRIGCFIYYPEEGTGAVKLPGKVDPDVARDREEGVMTLQQSISEELLRQRIGSETDVLVESALEDGSLAGRTPKEAPEVDGIFYLTGVEKQPESIVRARVTDTTEHDLFGELILRDPVNI